MKWLVVVVLAACGGGGQPPVSEPLPGDTHETVTTLPDAGAPDGAVADAGPAAPDAGPPPAASFELQNQGKVDLNFGVTKGWGPVIFAYTGKPPKAKAVIFFESACTASCESPAEALCPVCKEPETKKEELAMARLETVPAGGTLRVPWDGKLRVYENVRGRKGCRCFHAVEPAPGSYTVKSCGLRPPTKPGEPSRPVCTETPLTITAGEPLPATIPLSFTK